MSLPRIALFSSVLALAACGGDSPAEIAASAEPEPDPVAEAAPAGTPAAVAPDGEVAALTLRPVGELMEYQQTAFTVYPGQTVQLTFENTATNEAMSHNVVVLAQGADVNALGQAAMGAAETDYIPAGFEDQILAHTPMSAPGETVTVEFTVPDAPGDYTYICTFPGHYMMMQGTMHVVAPA